MPFIRPKITLRLKLALISLVLLVIPAIGIKISEQIKRDLLLSQEETLAFSARAVAAVLTGQPELFIRERLHPKDTIEMVYLPPLRHPIRLNADIDDWPEIERRAEHLGKEHLLFKSRSYDVNSFHALHMTGERGEYIYAFFKVTDDKVIYRGANSLRLDRSDHLQVRIEDNNGKLRQYQISPRQPGWVNGHLYEERSPAILEPRIQGAWKETKEGYTVELRLPREMVGNKLAFALVDVDDDKSRKVKYVLSSNRKYNQGESLTRNKDGKIVKKIKKIKTPEREREPGWIISPSETIESILKTFDRPNFRVSIVDANQRVRATYGELTGSPTRQTEPQGIRQRFWQLAGQLLAPIYRLFTTPFSNSIIAGPEALSTLNLDGVKQALDGHSSLTRYTPERGSALPGKEKETDPVEVMAAIVPLKNGGTTVGAVVVEQTTNTILALQNKVIEESVTVAALAFGVGGFALIFFAFRISSRIRTVGRNAANAITSSGQICPIPPMQSGDEIGDLSRTLANMLSQLKIQSDFRERMADNLEHEMRTPLAGISASLQNLAGELEDLPPETQRYVNWALEDVKRLEALMAEIRDATNLQEMLSNDQREEFALDIAIQMWLTHSWQPAFADAIFHYHPPQETLLFYGDPQRIHQMLDKLVENAVSFHTPGTTIELLLEKTGDAVALTVINTGPAIPEELQGQIFNSMVSKRNKGSGKDARPHLGLGLYIVRTIVEAYGGRVSVASSKELLQTAFRIELPSGGKR